MLRSQWHQLNRLPIIARSGSKLTQLWDTIVYNGVTTEPAINVVAARRQFSSESGDEREIENPKVIELAGQIMQLNLLEVSDLTELLRKRLNIQTSFAMPMGGMPAVAPSAGGDQQSTGGPAAAAKEEKTEFTVRLEGFDAASKIKVIKEVRAVTDLGLKEAKELVEGAPTVLKEGLSKEAAEQLKAKLEEAGAKVVLD